MNEISSKSNSDAPYTKDTWFVPMWPGNIIESKDCIKTFHFQNQCIMETKTIVRNVPSLKFLVPRNDDKERSCTLKYLIMNQKIKYSNYYICPMFIGIDKCANDTIIIFLKENVFIEASNWIISISDHIQSLLEQEIIDIIGHSAPFHVNHKTQK